MEDTGLIKLLLIMLCVIGAVGVWVVFEGFKMLAQFLERELPKSIAEGIQNARREEEEWQKEESFM